MMNGYGGWGVGAWLLMSLITLVVLALIVAGVVALNRRSHPATPPSPAPGAGGSDALHTLDDVTPGARSMRPNTSSGGICSSPGEQSGRLPDIHEARLTLRAKRAAVTAVMLVESRGTLN